ncbi:MAG: hypothetical protein J6X03_02930 [Bacilli bacterium]|nr:hypothetical protein [Bacilli bacterium]
MIKALQPIATAKIKKIHQFEILAKNIIKNAGNIAVIAIINKSNQVIHKNNLF